MHIRARQASKAPSHDEASRSLTRPVPSKYSLDHSLLKLQQTIGNQGVQRLVHSQPVQGLRPSQGRLLQRKCACGGTPEIDGECAECRKRRLQRRPTGQSEPSTVPPIVYDVLALPGQPLDSTTRNFMEPRFGHDFSKVRVHDDARAAESARAVNAVAYTVGSNIAFEAGKYAPHTREGQTLLAHELTHIVQQASAPTTPALGANNLALGDSADRLERAAGRPGERLHQPSEWTQASHGLWVGRTTSSAAVVQRQLAAASAPLQRTCTFNLADAPAIELAAARQTLALSARVAQMFAFPGLTARGRLERVAIDNNYWFAKLYELITYYEIAEANRFERPEFVLHFIPTFYNLYYDALQHFLKREFDRVSEQWMRYFRVIQRAFTDDLAQYLRDISESIITGVSAHINGDMATALEQSYRSFVAKYCLQNTPFETFRRDFFANNRPIFDHVKAAFLTDLARAGPFPVPIETGQFILGAGESSGLGTLGGARGLNVDEVYSWRARAWGEALSRLGQGP